MFLTPSPPSIAVPAAGGFAFSRQRFRFGFCRTHRGRHGLRRSSGCRDDCRPADPGVLHRGPTPLGPPARQCPPLSGVALRRLRRRTRLRTASLLGRAGVQQQQPVMRALLSTMTLSPAGPLDHLPGVLTPHRESHGRGRRRPPPRPLFLPPRRSLLYQSRPTAAPQSL